MKIIIDVASELDAKGYDADIAAATIAIDNWLRRELSEYLADMLESSNVTYTYKE